MRGACGILAVAVLADAVVRAGEPGVAGGEVGIFVDSMLEIAEGNPCSAVGAVELLVHASHVPVVGRNVRRMMPDAPLRPSGRPEQFDLQGGGDGAPDVVLDIKGVPGIAVVGLQ